MRREPEQAGRLMDPTRSETRVVVRPLGSPLPLGFLALFVATASFSAMQLGWVAPGQGRVIALSAVLFAAPLQALTSVLGFLARDPVAGTGMGVLSGTWAVAGIATLTSPPGSSSSGLGVVLVLAGVAMLVPALSAISKPVAAGVMTLAAVRFAVTGISELTGRPGWEQAAGIVGLVLAAFAVYAAFAFELEGVRGKPVLPLFRLGAAAAATSASAREQFADLEHEPGVRKQL